MSPSQVLVCGTNYGSAYIAALAHAVDRYSIAGILARGSERSRRAAERLGVPLVQKVEDVPAAVSLACAALGMNGHPVVLRLLEKGIGVLCEHPLPAGLMLKSLQAADESRTRFHVNGHWSGLEASLRFIAHARQGRRQAEPVHILVSATDRALYGVLDILAQALTRLGPVILEPVGRDGPFCCLRGHLGTCAATLRIECSQREDGGELQDGSPAYLNCYRIILEFAEGALSLLGPGGPVIWNANENRVVDQDRLLWEAVYDDRGTGGSLGRQRLDQNLQAMDALAADLSGGPPPPEQQPDALLDVSQAWESVGEVLAASLRNSSEP